MAMGAFRRVFEEKTGGCGEAWGREAGVGKGLCIPRWSVDGLELDEGGRKVLSTRERDCIDFEP